MATKSSSELANGAWREAVLLRSADWNDGHGAAHMAKTGELLRDARFLHQGRGADMKLLVDGGHDCVHSAVVAAHSLKLRALIANNEPPLTVDLTDLSRQAVRKTVDFMYTGRVTLTFNGLSALLQTAAALAVPSLQRTLEAYLRQMSVDSHHLVPCLNMAANDTSVVSHRTRVAVLRQAVDNWPRVRDSQNFHNLTVGTLCALLNDNHLPVGSELDVFVAALRWLTARPEHLESADRVFGCVRFGLMSTADKITAVHHARNSSVDAHIVSILQTHLADGDWYRTCREMRHSDLTPLRNEPRSTGQKFVAEQIRTASGSRSAQVSSAYCVVSSAISPPSAQIRSSSSKVFGERDREEESIFENNALSNIDTDTDSAQEYIGKRSSESIMEINNLPNPFEPDSQEYIGERTSESIMEINNLPNPFESSSQTYVGEHGVDSITEINNLPNPFESSSQEYIGERGPESIMEINQLPNPFEPNSQEYIGERTSESIMEINNLPNPFESSSQTYVGEHGVDSITEINELPDMFSPSSEYINLDPFGSQEYVGGHEADSIEEINALPDIDPIRSQMLLNGRDLSLIPDLHKTPAPSKTAFIPVSKEFGL